MSSSLFGLRDNTQSANPQPSPPQQPTDSPDPQSNDTPVSTTPEDPTIAAAEAYMAGRLEPVSLNIHGRLGDSAMRSLAASHVLNNGTIGDATRFVTDYYQRVHADIIARDDLSQQRIRTHLREVDDDTRQCRAELADLRSAQATVEATLRDAQKELPAILAEFRQVACSLRQEKLAKFADDMKAVDEINNLREQNVIQQVKAQIHLEHEIRKTFLDAAREQWRENEPAYDKRRCELETEQARVDTELNRMIRHVQGLRSVGVTRNVSGFLFWTGTLTVAAAASFLAEAINKHTGNQSHVNHVLGGLRTLMVGTAEPTLPRLIAGVGSTMAIIGIVAALVLGTALIAARYSPSPRWEKRRKRADGTDQSGPRLIARVVPSELIPSDVFARLSGLTPQAVVRLLPVIVLTFSSLCILVALSPKDAKWISVDMGTAVALVLSFHSLCILYGTFVLGPRLTRMLDAVVGTTSPKVPTRLWLAEVILTLFAVAALAAIVVTTLLPKSAWSGQVLAPAALFLYSGGFALPFSIVFRGIYKDHDFLEARRGFYRKEIGKLQCPMEADLDEAMLEEGVLLIKNRTAEREQQYLYQLRRYFYDDIGDLPEFQRAISSLVGDHAGRREKSDFGLWSPARSILRETRFGFRFAEALVYNSRIEPESLARFEAVYRKRCELRDKIVALEAQRAEIGRDISAHEQKVETLQRKSMDYEARLIELNRTQFDWSLKLSRNCKEDEIALHEAWVVAEMGSRSRTRSHVAAA